MARACRSASVSQPCAWIASPSAGQAEKHHPRALSGAVQAGSAHARGNRRRACLLLLRATHRLLSHHSRNAARLAHRTRDVILEIANRRRTDIARPNIRPGATPLLAFTGRSTAFPAGVRWQVEVPIVAAVAIDPKLRRPAPRLDDPGAAHAGNAACRCESWHDPGFKPTDGIGIFRHRIGKRPRAAARIALTAGGALGR